MPTNPWLKSLSDSIQSYSTTHIQLHIQVNGQSMFPYIDSGSNFTLVSYIMAKRLGILDSIKKSKQVRLAGVSSFRLLGSSSISVRIGKIVLQMDVKIVDTKEFDMLLGLDFLIPHRAVLNLDTMYLTLQDDISKQ
jgi:predicted aspartyl protease